MRLLCASGVCVCQCVSGRVTVLPSNNRKKVRQYDYKKVTLNSTSRPVRSAIRSWLRSK